jgi:hypothetical protein
VNNTETNKQTKKRLKRGEKKNKVHFMTRIVQFLCEGGDALDCPLDAALRCEAVRREVSQNSENESVIVIPMTLGDDLAPAPRQVAAKVVDYLEYFAHEQPSVIPKPKLEGVEHYLSTWEANFLRSLIDRDNPSQHQTLIMVLNAADQLGLAPLSDMLLAWVATQVETISNPQSGKRIMDAAEDIRQFFGIPNEWSDEELGHLSKEMAIYDDEAVLAAAAAAKS